MAQSTYPAADWRSIPGYVANYTIAWSDIESSGGINLEPVEKAHFGKNKTLAPSFWWRLSVVVSQARL